MIPVLEWLWCSERVNISSVLKTSHYTPNLSFSQALTLFPLLLLLSPFSIYVIFYFMFSVLYFPFTLFLLPFILSVSDFYFNAVFFSLFLFLFPLVFSPFFIILSLPLLPCFLSLPLSPSLGLCVGCNKSRVTVVNILKSLGEGEP